MDRKSRYFTCDCFEVSARFYWTFLKHLFSLSLLCGGKVLICFRHLQTKALYWLECLFPLNSPLSELNLYMYISVYAVVIPSLSSPPPPPIHRILALLTSPWPLGRTKRSYPTVLCWRRAARQPWSWPSMMWKPRCWPTSTASTCLSATRYTSQLPEKHTHTSSLHIPEII